MSNMSFLNFILITAIIGEIRIHFFLAERELNLLFKFFHRISVFTVEAINKNIAFSINECRYDDLKTPNMFMSILLL